MGDLGQRLLAAAREGDLTTLRACLAAGTDPNVQHDTWPHSPLHAAARCRHADCVAALLAAVADPHAKTVGGGTPLHMAAGGGCTACVAALLAAGAGLCAVDDNLQLATHLAAFYDQPSVLRQLLAADPETALQRDRLGRTPLQVALVEGHADAARCLLEVGLLQPAGGLLAAVFFMPRDRLAAEPPLYTMIAGHQPLARNEWARKQTPCPGLGAALPAVLARSTTEARLLVQHLSPMDRQRLRVLALCLGRAQRGLPTPLPAPILWHILAIAATQ